MIFLRDFEGAQNPNGLFAKMRCVRDQQLLLGDHKTIFDRAFVCAAMSMGSGVTPLLITVSEAKDVPFRADPFVVLEAGGARTQTDVLRDTTAPVWDQMFTLRADFSAGTREELKVMAWHEDVYEDQLLGRATLDIESCLLYTSPSPRDA